MSFAAPSSIHLALLSASKYMPTMAFLPIRAMDIAVLFALLIVALKFGSNPGPTASDRPLLTQTELAAASATVASYKTTHKTHGFPPIHTTTLNQVHPILSDLSPSYRNFPTASCLPAAIARFVASIFFGAFGPNKRNDQHTGPGRASPHHSSNRTRTSPVLSQSNDRSQMINKDVTHSKRCLKHIVRGGAMNSVAKVAKQPHRVPLEELVSREHTMQEVIVRAGRWSTVSLNLFHQIYMGPSLPLPPIYPTWAPIHIIQWLAVHSQLLSPCKTSKVEPYVFATGKENCK